MRVGNVNQFYVILASLLGILFCIETISIIF